MHPSLTQVFTHSTKETFMCLQQRLKMSDYNIAHATSFLLFFKKLFPVKMSLTLHILPFTSSPLSNLISLGFMP